MRLFFKTPTDYPVEIPESAMIMSDDDLFSLKISEF